MSLFENLQAPVSCSTVLAPSPPTTTSSPGTGNWHPERSRQDGYSSTPYAAVPVINLVVLPRDRDPEGRVAVTAQSWRDNSQNPWTAAAAGVGNDTPCPCPSPQHGSRGPSSRQLHEPAGAWQLRPPAAARTAPQSGRGRVEQRKQIARPARSPSPVSRPDVLAQIKHRPSCDSQSLLSQLYIWDSKHSVSQYCHPKYLLCKKGTTNMF
jgi:hypothetical protein